MFPTINKRFLLKVLLVTLLVGGSVFALHAVQAGRIPDALRRQADLATADGKRDAAIGYLRQYLEFRPADADVQEQLAGLLKARIGNGPPTELLFLYEKILRADPARHAVRREAMTAALRLRRFTDAAAHADLLVKQFPTEAELWRSLAQAHAGQGKADEAVRGYEKAIELDPTDSLAYQELAQFQWKELKQVPAARATLDRLVVAAPHDPQPYLLRARFDALVQPAGSGDPIDLHKALELDPENLDALIQLAEHLQRNRDALGAHDCLSAARRLHPGDTHTVRALAWLELNRGNLGAAVSVLEDGLERSADGFDLMVPLADLLVQMGNTDRPREIVAKLNAVRGSPATVRVARMQSNYLTGRLAMRDRQWAVALKTLAELRTMAVQLPGLENQADMLMAVCQQRLGDPAKEAQLLHGILNRDPNHLAARGALAVAYLNAGRVEEAMPEYEKVTRSQYATPDSHVALLKLRANRLRSSAKATPAQWNELERSVAPIVEKMGPASTDALRLRADLASWRGDRRRAVAILQQEAARRPRDPTLWAALAVATADFGGLATGLAVLDEAQAMAGDGADLRLCRAALYARDPAHLRPLAPLAAHIDTWPDADQLRLLYGLIEVYDRLGDDTGVLATYRRLAARRPAELPLWEAYYERAVKAKDEPAARAARAAIARLEPTPGKAAAMCAAWDAVAARNASAAPAALANLVAQFGPLPERGEACVALARLKALTGDTTSPLELFERAVQLEPRRFTPTQELIEYLAATGDKPRLAALLTRLDRDHRWCGEPLQRVVWQSLTHLEPNAGKELLELASKQVEWLPGGTGWIGDGYRLCGAKAEAMACYERAVADRAATADDWLRLAVRTGELDSPAAAAKVMARAKDALGDQRTPLYLTLAAAFRESGKGPPDWTLTTAAATDRRQYAQARLALKLSQFDRTAAVGVLESFLSDNGLTPGDSAWARQNLAMLLVARGNPTDRARAKELLAGADAAGGTPDEKRATVAVLAGLSRHLDGADRTTVFRRAITLLEAVAAETKSDRDRFLLAQMHRTAGDRSAGRTILIELLKSAPTNLDYLISALDEATEPADVEFADRCATVLRRTYPDEFRAVAAVTRHDCRVGNPDRALTLISTYARAADAGPNDLQLRAARSGELLDELARRPNIRKTAVGRKMTDAAVKLYEELYPTRPEAVVAVAGLLASDGRAAEAFAEIEKHARNLPPRVKQMAGLAVMRCGGGTPDQVAAVKGWLAKAKAEEPASVAVLLDEGELCVLIRDAAGSQAAYEAAVEKDPTSVVALNNLAWTLAADPDAATRVKELLDRATREVGLTADLLDTRARMRIAAGQYDAAESDLKHALALGQTPLRLFHMALLNDLRKPRKPDAVKEWLAKAMAKGLDEPMLHPADVKKFRAMKME